MYPTSSSRHSPRSINSMQLRKAILRLRWIGQEEEIDKLLLDLEASGSSEIWPMEPLETD